MSGHSKWLTIKRQKGAADAARGQIFTKLSNAITIAVKQSGGISDPESNFKLRLAIDRARSANMPKENIERAIARAGIAAAGQMDEVLYEGFAPGGVALIIEAVTDNKNRTISEIKNILEKGGGSLGTPGAVSYQFAQKGLITINKNNMSLDDIFNLAVGAGVEDIEEAGSQVLFYTDSQQLKRVKDAVLEQGLSVTDAELIKKPVTTLLVDHRETADKVLSLIEKIEALDDVQKVYSNLEIPDNFIS